MTHQDEKHMTSENCQRWLCAWDHGSKGKGPSRNDLKTTISAGNTHSKYSVTIMKHTILAKKTICNDSMDIQFIQQRISILTQRCCVDDDLYAKWGLKVQTKHENYNSPRNVHQLFSWIRPRLCSPINFEREQQNIKYYHNLVFWWQIHCVQHLLWWQVLHNGPEPLAGKIKQSNIKIWSSDCWGNLKRAVNKSFIQIQCQAFSSNMMNCLFRFGIFSRSSTGNNTDTSVKNHIEKKCHTNLGKFTPWLGWLIGGWRLLFPSPPLFAADGLKHENNLRNKDSRGGTGRVDSISES